MKNNKNSWIYGIIIFTVIFLGGAILFQIFKIEDLPSQFYGALIGVVITAIITVFLLKGQTANEEEKERSIKVFETKSELFTKFIDELWKVWEDKSVSLEELSHLMKKVSQNIIPYANPKSSEDILVSLNKIAEKATPSQSDSNDEETRRTIQDQIFTIINILSKEIGLGGEITKEMQKELDELEKKILPSLNKKNFIETIDTQLREKTKDFLHSMEVEGNVLWWKVGNNTGVWLRIGQWGSNLYLAFWSAYNNSQYRAYRYTTKGENKDFLRIYTISEKISLEDFEDVLKGKKTLQQKTQEFITEIILFVTERTFDKVENGKTITDIINECNN